MALIYVGTCRFGRGVFAATHIDKGQVLLRFRGNLVTAAEMLASARAENMLQIGDELYLDIDAPGVLVNHSCEPNAGIVRDRTLVAIREIRADEEIRYDYSTTMLERLWTMACDCRTCSCRKTITDFDLLPRVLQEHYVRLGVVQRFIVHRLRFHVGLEHA